MRWLWNTQFHAAFFHSFLKLNFPLKSKYFLHNASFHKIRIIKVAKLRKMIVMERAVSTEMNENTYEILDRNYESKGPLEITRLQWKDSVK